jgi:hypothetical protein
MKILKNIVDDQFTSQNHGLIFGLKGLHNEIEFDIGDLIEHDSKIYQITDKDLSTPSIIGTRRWYVKVAEFQEK